VTDGRPVVTDVGGVRRITLDRPEAANALTLDDLAVVEAAVIGVPDDVRALVFGGSPGGVFSAGMHVDAFLTTPATEGRTLIEQVGSCVGAVRTSPLPTVAVVEGHCLGAAFELALACDVRICSPTATFGLPEVRLGIPSVVDAALLRDYVGLGLAKEMILTGGIYPLDRVPTLANVVVEADRLDRVVGDMVQRLTAPTREVIAAQKSLFETWLNVGLRDGIEVSKQVFGEVFALPVTQEAIAAYEAARRRRS
jgi:enoyl-CoA hydratase/carnithine racemase